MESSLAILKDFAGPVATIIASLTAAYVTFKIQDENRRLKRGELKIAFFDKRYQVYSSTVEYIRYIKSRNEYNIVEELPKSQEFGRTVLESRFTCSLKAQQHLELIRDIAFAYVGAADKIKDASAEQERREALQERRELSRKLDNLLKDLPTVFEQDLRLRYIQ